VIRHKVWGWCYSHYAGLGYCFKYCQTFVSERRKSQIKRLFKKSFQRKSIHRGHRGKYGS